MHCKNMLRNVFTQMTYLAFVTLMNFLLMFLHDLLSREPIPAEITRIFPIRRNELWMPEKFMTPQILGIFETFVGIFAIAAFIR